MILRAPLVRMAVILALSFLALGCEEELRRPERTGAPAPRATRGYILISIDTLRADHLGLYGYPRPTSPFLDSLARRATVFEEAYSQFPSTLVSHMSMLTGLYPREHGVLQPNAVLSPKVETLPEVFQRNGFRTAGFTEGGYVSGRYGFRRGFDVFASRDRGLRGDRLVEQTFHLGTSFLKSLGPQDRFFLFLHTYAVHAPYDAPRRYQDLFWSGPPPPGAIPPTSPALIRWDLTGEGPPPAAVIDRLRAQYDAGIRQTDDVLRSFFADLERLGLANDVTVVITADHGEEFQDHGRFNHTQLYQETLHVPLLILHPDASVPVRHGGVVQLVDLAPTFYELARLKARGRPSGASLASRIGNPSPPSPGTAWGESVGGARSVYRGEHARLDSLLLFNPPAEDWLPRRVSFDHHGGSLAFQARSFLEPRLLTVRRGGETLEQVTLVPDWAPVQTADFGPGRLSLEADGCVDDPQARQREPSCHSFQVRGLRLTRIELYDLSRDPGQIRDLSRERTRTMRALLKDLAGFRPRPVATAATAPLDPELEESLRALGYIR